MSNYREYFKKELNAISTKYFILDTAGSGAHGDVDFQSYNWELDKFNRVNEGDLFIYRRQQKASEINGQFYFFGAGKIERIESLGGKRVKGIISKPMIFNNKLLKSDLENFIWTFKTRGSSWEHFFNQYGMNTVTKDDFIKLLESAEGTEVERDQEEGQVETEVELYQQQQRGNFRVEDQKGDRKVRGAGQKVFADQVKASYGYTCAVTGIKTKEFLVASHIIPWAEDKENRLNPRNGICLSTLIDKAFDKGYLTITKRGTVLLSDALKEDIILYKMLEPYKGQKIRVKKQYAPLDEFLDWHYEHIFKK